MTGSKRVVTLEQCNGCYASNETLCRVEMGLEEGVLFQEDVNYVLDGVLKQPGLCVGMAWDNFDINIETLNGLGTIHHTYGIIYQNISPAVAEVACIPAHRNSGWQFSKVSCSAKNDTIEPYYKKPKISDMNSPHKNSYHLHLSQCTIQETFYEQLESHFSHMIYHCGMTGFH